MIIYPDTEKELTFDDYKQLPSLREMSLPSLYELKNNLEKAIENAWLYGSDLLQIKLNMDLKIADLYIRMKEKQKGR